MSGKLPDFLMIGGMRCGSTTLNNILAQHPQIYLPNTKELHFFDQRNPDLGNDLEKYKAVFNACKEGDICGEATPDYLTTPYCDERIASSLNKPKFIVILREPVARLCSHYRMSVANGVEPLSFEEAIQSEHNRLKQRSVTADIFHSYQERSDYLPHLKRFAERFGRKNLHIIFLEDLNVDASTALSSTLNFLGVEPIVTAEMKRAIKVTNRSKDMMKLKLPKWRKILESFYEGHLTNRQALIPETLRQNLKQKYLPKNTELGQWLNRELPW